MCAPQVAADKEDGKSWYLCAYPGTAVNETARWYTLLVTACGHE